MTPHPAVLLGLRASDSGDRVLRDRLEGWVRRCGFRTRFTADAHEAVSWLEQEAFAATIVDSDLGLAEGEAVWRVIRSPVEQRVVLMARDRRQALWFEALRKGVTTVLPMPPREAMVKAALAAATRCWGDGAWDHPLSYSSSQAHPSQRGDA
jgi:DNA-binding NtrC family response regulator